ncbi:hypothetical protein DIU31_008150 [Mucilaginibacter rubeus]|uniref:Uncharacterized protein n=1 Tax=Mucilaginibacter rubeus TaxID=2027860 RepID=A0AAE6JDC9_9SPHI|nr:MULTISPECIES: hypothetical protein [Mucilaginibacter]QEM03490.1 hypothetical protein DIU31_008150 [Mucilaginibacter rubeus]QEM16105.1 hypothetical protein DIU38_008240 [Mucilaginibacter gossypii]QTE41142.1 hypothetical protein J3L19_19525 [Mucilaginibacter rubeus]QTE47745.1 hypothetical protein J3L21_19505 [Mucilaginibacter rubeus]QTE59136.1 hypothetical protein J3L23_11165 [Mucilaginibacter rubeus]
MSNIQIWQGPNGINLPVSAKEAKEIMPLAAYLSEKQKNQIISAFQVEAYDMAAEYAWKKAMVKLKETIATLGLRFIGEMLNRDDIDEYTSIDSVLTDYSAIQLAEQLGVIGNTAALKLRHCNELITHYFSKNAEEELDYNTAFSIVKSSVQYILGESDVSIALEFSQFRQRLLNESLRTDDDQVDQIVNSPLFYLRTVMTILLASVKNDIGAKLEHAIANLNLLISPVWKKLGENDKWNIGTAYRDVTAAGNTVAASGLKTALLKVGGFDYVPENLRSITFIKAAQQVLETHFAFNNFYNEPAAISKLANLGSTIPSPALIECMQAYLAVYLGNNYGVSNGAASIAYRQLSNISEERWNYYFEKVLQNDDVILSKMNDGQVNRFRTFLMENNFVNFTGLPKKNQQLYDAILAYNVRKARLVATELYESIKK